MVILWSNTKGIKKLTLNCNFEQPTQSVGVDNDEIFRYITEKLNVSTHEMRSWLTILVKD